MAGSNDAYKVRKGTPEEAIDLMSQRSRDRSVAEATDYNKKDKTARKIDDVSRKSRLKADIMDAKGR